MMRRIGKQILTLLIVFTTGWAVAGEWRPIVVDPLSGVAIQGMDAVSYFTEPSPLPGRSDYEYYWHDVPWYFASAANRDAFIGAPELYAPQFGGHAAMSLARGFLSEGNPRIYAIIEGRVYFFYSVGNRDAFLMSREASLAKATATWQKLAE
jgi:YHS domain-containing protein